MMSSYCDIILRYGAALELRRYQMMFVQQLVELGTVTLGDTRRLTDITVGYLQQLGEVLTLEMGTRVGESRHFTVRIQGHLYDW